MLRYGNVFNGSAQELGVNVIANQPAPEKWKNVEGVVIEPGEKWYYASLAAEISDDDEVGDEPIYLIHDKVRSDGWGYITIYKDVTLVAQGSSDLPTFGKMMW